MKKKFKPTIAEIEKLMGANEGKVLTIEENGDITTTVNGKKRSLLPAIKVWRKELAASADKAQGGKEGE